MRIIMFLDRLAGTVVVLRVTRQRALPQPDVHSISWWYDEE
jgi:hypothetical protein